MSFWTHAPDEDTATALATRHPDWRFTDGEPPEGAEYEVLVAGRLSPARSAVAVGVRRR